VIFVTKLNVEARDLMLIFVVEDSVLGSSGHFVALNLTKTAADKVN